VSLTVKQRELDLRPLPQNPRADSRRFVLVLKCNEDRLRTVASDSQGWHLRRPCDQQQAVTRKTFFLVMRAPPSLSCVGTSERRLDELHPAKPLPTNAPKVRMLSGGPSCNPTDLLVSTSNCRDRSMAI